MDRVLLWLKEKGLKVKVKKCKYQQEKIEYLGYVITPQGIFPIKQKVDAILKIDRPCNLRQLCGFVGLANFYCHMYLKQVHFLTLLTNIMSNKQEYIDQFLNHIKLHMDYLIDEKLIDIGFMFDAHIEKATRNFKFGNNVNVNLSYVEQEPGALQVS